MPPASPLARTAASQKSLPSAQKLSFAGPMAGSSSLTTGIRPAPKDVNTELADPDAAPQKSHPISVPLSHA